MNDARDRLIAALAADARPVRHPGRIGGVTAAWLAVAIVVGIGGLLWHEPASVFRGPQLAQSPRFLLETVLGFAAIGVLALAAFRTGLPSPPSLHARLLPWLPLVAWGLVQVLSLWHPAIEPTMAGKRDHCVFEVLVLAVPGVVIGCLALRRLWPLRGARAGLWLGLAGGAIPALAMLFICQYEPRHNLLFHFGPVLVSGAIGAALGAWLLRRY